MSLKNRYKLFIFSALAFSATSAFAGNQGIHMYYGAGLGGANIDLDSGPSQSSGLIQGFAGIEEDGWALEVKALKFYKAGEAYESGQSTTLNYRTVEQGGKYLKFKYGSLDFNFDGDETDGNVYGLGMGFRLQKDQRLELEYSYTDQEDNGVVTTSTKYHMLTLNYIFGGAPGDGGLFDLGLGGRSDKSAIGPFYTGVMLGLVETDLGEDYDTGTSFGVLLGYDLSKTGYPGLSVELLIGTTAATDSSLLDPAYPDEYTATMIGLYAALRTSGDLYFKARLGLINMKIEDDTYLQTGPTTFIFDETISDSDTAISYGIGAGYQFSRRSRAELEYTMASLSSEGLDFDPSLISFSYLYSF